MADERAPGGLLRSNLVVAAGTALSRITGFLRVYALAAVLGQAALADAYESANNSPNAVYELLLGGVLSASLVPLFTRHREDDDHEATSAVITTMLVVLVGLTAVAVLAAPLIFHLQSLDVVAGVDADNFRWLGSALARIFLVQIFFYGLSALWGAVLASHQRFFAAAWSPVLANIVTIVMLLVVQAELKPGDPFVQALGDAGLRRNLGLGATIGIALMALSMYPAVRRTGVRVSLRPQFNHPAVRQMLRLSGWTFGYAAANVMTAIVIKNLASPGSGRQVAYTRAFTVFQLPHGLLAMSITTTFVPELVRRVKRRDRQGFIERTEIGIRTIGLLTIPAAAVMFTLRRPIVGALLQHGAMTAPAALEVSRALGGFAVGLAGFSIYLFVLRGFYAHGDARTPFVINLVECALNIGLAVLLVGRSGLLGLGLAFGLAYVLTALWALQILAYKVPGFSARRVLASLGRMTLASVIAGESAWIAARFSNADAGIGAAIRVAVGGVVGLGVFSATLHLLGPDMNDIRRLVRHQPANDSTE